MVLGHTIYLMFERSAFAPIIVGSFMDSCSNIHVTVSLMAVAVSASTLTDLGKILHNVPGSANA